MVHSSDSSHAGFYARNKMVAQSENLIALTWGPSTTKPKSGGTKHTWDLCGGHRIHVPLSQLVAGTFHIPNVLTFKRVSSIKQKEEEDKEESKEEKRVAKTKQKKQEKRQRRIKGGKTSSKNHSTHSIERRSRQ